MCPDSRNVKSIYSVKHHLLPSPSLVLPTCVCRYELPMVESMIKGLTLVDQQVWIPPLPHSKFITMTMSCHLVFLASLTASYQLHYSSVKRIYTQVAGLRPPLLLPGCVLSHFSCVQLFATIQTVACQAPLPMGFSRQGYWSGLPCPPPGDLPDPGIVPTSLMPPALAGGFFSHLPG